MLANGPEGTDGAFGSWGPVRKREHLTGPMPAREFKPAFQIYDLRHTCITLWLQAGVPVHVASKLAGHATAAFTLTVYAKALPDQKLEAAAKMDALFGTSRPIESASPNDGSRALCAGTALLSGQSSRYFRACLTSAANASTSTCCAGRCRIFRAPTRLNRSHRISYSTRLKADLVSNSPSSTCHPNRGSARTKNSRLSKPDCRTGREVTCAMRRSGSLRRRLLQRPLRARQEGYGQVGA